MAQPRLPRREVCPTGAPAGVRVNLTASGAVKLALIPCQNAAGASFTAYFGADIAPAAEIGVLG